MSALAAQRVSLHLHLPFEGEVDPPTGPARSGRPDDKLRGSEGGCTYFCRLIHAPAFCRSRNPRPNPPLKGRGDTMRLGTDRMLVPRNFTAPPPAPFRSAA